VTDFGQRTTGHRVDCALDQWKKGNIVEADGSSEKVDLEMITQFEIAHVLGQS
jgi:hypothetical protein